LPDAARRSKSRLPVALVLALLALLACIGCAPAPTRPIVSAIDLRETAAPRVVDDSAVLNGLATYDEYDRNVLSRDLDRVERYYRERGYYEAKVTASRVLEPDPRHVRIEIRVAVGKPVIVRSVDRQGDTDFPLTVNIELGKARDLLQVGAIFDESHFDDMKSATLDALRDNGYPFAKVDAKAHVDLTTHTADVTIAITPGVRANYGEVSIIGLHDIPEGPVRDNVEVAIRRGKRYSRSDLAEARQALLNLGVFSSVDIHDDLTHPERKIVPIQIVVHEGSLHTVRIGGGATFDVLRLNGHLKVGWEHLNFLGGMRDLQLTATPGIDLYPTRLDGNTPLAPTRALPENSIQLKFMQPAFIEGRTTGTIDANYDIKPLLYPLTYPATGDNAPAKQRIVGYQSLTTAFGLKRDFPIRFSRKLRGNLEVVPAYNWQADFPFMYQSDRPQGLVPVRVAFPSLNTTFDLVDDRLNPHAGIRLINRVEVADKIFGGSVSDFKIQPDFRAYIPITPKTVTLATRLSFGFLVPRDYGQTLNTNTSAGSDPTAPAAVTDQEKLLLRAFYSGGANSNRGYPLRGVGPHGTVGFLIPTGLNCTIPAGTTPAEFAVLNPACIRPTGGFTLWEASLELRFPISGPVNMVAFADASDVTRNVGHVRFNEPHLSVGPGLRYSTPVGSLRLDIGYRVPGAQEIGRNQLEADEGGNDLGTLFNISWLPVALNIALGEAF
jgi:outer membrane protein assembly factor BamA